MKSFQTLLPSYLTQVVSKITVITEECPLQVENSMTYLADGLPGLMYHQTEHPVYKDGKEKNLSKLFLYGQTVKPIEITAFGPFKAIIIHLYPHVMKSLFGFDAHELRDGCVAFETLKDVRSAGLVGQLHDVQRTGQQIEILLANLQHRYYRLNIEPPHELQFATQQIINSRGNADLAAILKRLSISERTFERKFLTHVGVSPSLFKRICKFKSSLIELENNSYHLLTDVAYSQGFADQSHFNRTFKEFTGVSPKQYIANLAGQAL